MFRLRTLTFAMWLGLSLAFDAHAGSAAPASEISILDQSPRDAGVTGRLMIFFRVHGLRSLREAALWTTDEFLDTDNMGPGTLRELLTLLEKASTSLGQSPFLVLTETERLWLARSGIWTLTDLHERWDEVLATAPRHIIWNLREMRRSDHEPLVNATRRIPDGPDARPTLAQCDELMGIKSVKRSGGK